MGQQKTPDHDQGFFVCVSLLRRPFCILETIRPKPPPSSTPPDLLLFCPVPPSRLMLLVPCMHRSVFWPPDPALPLIPRKVWKKAFFYLFSSKIPLRKLSIGSVLSSTRLKQPIHQKNSILQPACNTGPIRRSAVLSPRKTKSTPSD